MADEMPEPADSMADRIGAVMPPCWKRRLDVSCIFVTAPCWLMLMALIGLWVKLVSPGPVFYRQARIGWRGRRFLIRKFRSMRANSDTRSHELHLQQLIESDTPMVKLDSLGDPRLIPGGRIIRALGLDELPQLFNVLRGDMSLVGPRPCTPEEFAHYEAWQKARANVLPGLTGHWQVNGKNRTTFNQMIVMDLFYARNMSFRGDLAIILKTVPAIIAQVIESKKNRFWESCTHMLRGAPRSVNLSKSMEKI
jgi:lipopolysaccharide/colanic/teichoic acid biosynthesis glycosyltransferase